MHGKGSGMDPPIGLTASVCDLDCAIKNVRQNDDKHKWAGAAAAYE